MKQIIFAGITLLFVAGCEAIPVAQPTNSDGPQPNNPTTPNNIDPVSGLDKNSIVSIMGIENKVVLFFVENKADPAQFADASARLCAARGMRLASFEVKDLDHPETMPGIRKLVATCR